jgi:hypothetical protein
MRPYPWYEINGLTLELEPYAAYASARVHFERCYQPEPDRVITDQSLADSIRDDEERYGWISGDPIVRDIVHSLWSSPDELAKFDQINREYMDGFRGRAHVDQARIHLMTACLGLGDFEDEAVTKKLLKTEAKELWTRAWLRSEKKFFPSRTELDAASKRIAPNVADKFHWSDAFRDLGLLDMPSFREQD